MKKILIIALAFTSLTFLNPLNAQDNGRSTPNFPKLDASPMDLALYRDQNDEPVARVIYSRPQKRDREVFGKLVPYGEVWRTGANEASEITLYKDMKVADVVVDAGTYSLYTIPEEKEWTVILSQSTNQWGAYEYKDEDDLVRIKAPVRNTSNSIEALSMTFERTEKGTDLLIGWDDRYIKVPFRNVE